MMRQDKIRLYLQITDTKPSAKEKVYKDALLEEMLLEAGRLNRKTLEDRLDKLSLLARFRSLVRQRPVLVTAVAAILLILAVACVATGLLSKAIKFFEQNEPKSDIFKKLPPKQGKTSGGEKLPMVAVNPRLYSPNKIFFLSDRTGTNQVFSMNPDGSDVKQITESNTGCSYFDVTRDGIKIVFCTLQSEQEPQSTIKLMNTDGTNSLEIGQGLTPSFSPSGLGIAYGGDDGLHIIDVMANQNRVIMSAVRVQKPVWSEQGDKIACLSKQDTGQRLYSLDVVSAVSGDVIQRIADLPWYTTNWCFSAAGDSVVYPMDGKILALDLNDGSIHMVVDKDGGSNWCPKMSQDGHYLYYLAQSTDVGPSSPYLYLLDTSSYQKDKIAELQPEPGDGGGPFFSISPDGMNVVIASYEDQKTPIFTNDKNIFTISRNGGKSRLTTTGQNFAPVWR